jgi:ABC-type branched-subunit amino acid transport system permease subunit
LSPSERGASARAVGDLLRHWDRERVLRSLWGYIAPHVRGVVSLKTLFWTAVVGCGFVLPVTLGAYWSFVIAEAASVAIIMLSLTLLTGYGGQLSLAQPAFVGAGAYGAGLLAQHLHLSLFAAIPLAMIPGWLLGLLVGVPALRLSGMYLAISTFALAGVAGGYVFQLPQLGGLSGMTLDRVHQPWGLGSNVAFCYICLGCFAAVLTAVWRIRDSHTGWSLNARREDERVAELSGVDVPVAKLMVFAYSGAIAALGGALAAYLALHINPLDFTPFNAVIYLALLVVTGVRRLGGPVAAGALYVGLPQMVGLVNPHWLPALPLVFPVLLALALIAGTGALPRTRELVRHLRV